MKLQIVKVVSVALVALIALAVWRYYQEDTAALVAAQQQEKSARYLTTDLGRTRYQIFGEHNQPTIVLIHGFNGFLESWTPNIDPLVRAGYRVIAYDMWGRGLSDRPRIDLSLNEFRAQLKALIDTLGVKNVSLMGSSFGCVVASDYALHYPDQVENLVMIGPAGWPSDGDANWVRYPLIGDALFLLAGQKILRPKVEAYFYQPPAAWALAAWDQYAAYPGFMRSALSSLRHAPVTDYTEGWRQLGVQGKPTLFVWGKQDVSFPYSNTAKVAVLMPKAKILGIDGAAHWVNIEKADEVNSAVLRFLQRSGS